MFKSTKEKRGFYIIWHKIQDLWCDQLFCPCTRVLVESKPHAASMSRPRDCRSVVIIPLALRPCWNARIAFSSDPSNGVPGKAWKRMRFILHLTLFNSRASSFTCRGVSLIPLNIMYSNEILRYFPALYRIIVSTTSFIGYTF